MSTLLPFAATSLLLTSVAAADVGVTLANFGLIGDWANDCTAAANASELFKIVIARPADGAPTYTTINLDGGHRTTVHSVVQAAEPVPLHRIKLRLRIFGGDVDGGPLPSPTTNTFEQTFEVASGLLRMLGSAPVSLQRCAG